MTPSTARPAQRNAPCRPEPGDPSFVFTLSVLFLLNAAAVQAQVESHKSRALPVAQARNTHDG